MNVTKIGFAAIPVTDMKRARAFYEGVLGLEPACEMMGGKWLEYAVGQDTLAIASLETDWVPSDQGTAARQRARARRRRQPECPAGHQRSVS